MEQPNLQTLSNWISAFIRALNIYNPNTITLQWVYRLIMILAQYSGGVPKKLPNELIQLIALKLPIINVNKILRSSAIKPSDLNNFWYQLFTRDFPSAVIDGNNIDWKILYKEYYLHIGDIQCYGSNDHGQLGMGISPQTMQYNTKPAQIYVNNQKLRGKYVACGAAHTIIMDTDNHLWGFGINYHGELGLGDRNSRISPTKITFGDNDIKIKHVACNSRSTVAIDFNGNLWGFGDNSYNILGIPDQPIDPKIQERAQNIQPLDGENFPPIIVQNRSILRSCVCVPTRIPVPFTQSKSPSRQKTQVSPRFKYVSCGGEHTMLIDTNNDLWGFGRIRLGGMSEFDVLKDPTKLLIKGSPIKAKFVSCGNKHTMFIDMDDFVWGFGNNNFMQLGETDNPGIPSQIKIDTLPVKAKYIYCGYNTSYLVGFTDEVTTFYIDPTIPNRAKTRLLDDANTGDIIKVKLILDNTRYVFAIDLDGNVLWAPKQSTITDGKLPLVKKYLPDQSKFMAKYASCGIDHYVFIV